MNKIINCPFCKNKIRDLSNGYVWCGIKCPNSFVVGFDTYKINELYVIEYAFLLNNNIEVKIFSEKHLFYPNKIFVLHNYGKLDLELKVTEPISELYILSLANKIKTFLLFL